MLLDVGKLFKDMLLLALRANLHANTRYEHIGLGAMFGCSPHPQVEVMWTHGK